MSDDLYLKAWLEAARTYSPTMLLNRASSEAAAVILRERFVPRVTGPHDGLIDGLIERLQVQKVPDEMESHELALADFKHGYEMCVLDGRHAAGAIASLQAELAEARRERAELREWLAMAVAEMSYARGRLETIALCNEDRRIAAALGRTCNCARAALGDKQ